jgi:hypothetical protein
VTNAATLTYYYVSGLYRDSNTLERPLFTTGYVTIDESEAPGGSIAGTTIEPDFEGDGEPGTPWYWPSYVKALEFRSGSYPAFTWRSFPFGDSFFRFDANKKLVDWRVGEEGGYVGGGPRGDGYDNRNWGDYAFRSFGGKFFTPGIQSCIDEIEYQCIDDQTSAYLTRLGYQEGTRKWEKYFNYGWLSQFYDDSDEGMWFENPNDFALRVAEITRAGVASPPRSIHDIPPVPVPLPAALLVGAVIALVAATRSRRRA